MTDPPKVLRAPKLVCVRKIRENVFKRLKPLATLHEVHKLTIKILSWRKYQAFSNKERPWSGAVFFEREIKDRDKRGANKIQNISCDYTDSFLEGCLNRGRFKAVRFSSFRIFCILN